MTTTIQVGKSEAGPLLADLYLPVRSGPHPLVVAVSGGGWSRGDRGALAAWGRHLATQGLAVASIDYRRAITGPVFPGNAEDVAAAMKYFARDGSRHGVDATRIAILGVSAGAHLGALVALDSTFGAPPPRAFAGIYGVYDLVAHWHADALKHAEPGTDKTERMLGAPPAEAPDLYRVASPMSYVSRDRALPVHLVWGHLDTDVAPGQSAAFARALRESGSPVSVTELPEAGHLWFSQQDPDAPGTFSARVAPALTQFFADTLGVRP